MKKIFKKSLAVFMTVLMLLSVVSVSVLAATYTIKFAPGTYGQGTAPDPVVVNSKINITLPGAAFTRRGYEQAGWSTAASGTRKNYDLNGTYKVTGNRTLYPYWEAEEYTVTFAPGEYGVGTEQTYQVDFNKTVYAPGEIFTRDGYILTGWTATILVIGSDGDYEDTDEIGPKGKTAKVTGDVTYYPIWTKLDFTISVSETDAKFGSVCVDYATPAAQIITITNKGNVKLSYTLPTSENYNVSLASGSLNLDPGKTLSVSIQPKAALSANAYVESLIIDCIYDEADVTINASFSVNEHSFDRYVSDNNATYEADGTKHADCSNGCGTVDIIADIGSMKIYSADNNTAQGLLEEYIYHKTIRVTAYGSGTDNVQADGSIAEGTKRYLPVSWYVNDEFNGEFTEGNFDINFVHTSFGDYTLTIKYVEQEYVDGEWVATGEEDEKSFDYYVGATAKEEQEVVRPNMIVSIIFGLFAKIVELFGGLFG